MHTITSTIQTSLQLLTPISDTPKLDAELLLAEILQCSRTILHTWPNQEITTENYQAFMHLCQRRATGEPIAYLLGRQSFWKFTLNVTPDVLIPRPETELVVELILELCSNKENLMVVDLGTGSGAIALALAYENPTWKILATDNSNAALNIAQENANHLGIEHIKWKLSDWYSALSGQKFNIIVSNPPYIAPNDVHLSSLQYEPQTALVALQRGFAALETIITEAPQHLLDNGYLLVEHGYQQAEVVQILMQKAGLAAVQTYVDLAGQPRVTCGMLLQSKAG